MILEKNSFKEFDMKPITILLNVAFLSFAASAFAQVEQYVEKLNQIKGQMFKAEERIHGKELKKAEDHERKAISGLDEIIKELTEKKITETPKVDDIPKDGDKKCPHCGKPEAPKNPNDPAHEPYCPERTDPASPFKDPLSKSGRWGILPPKVHESIYKEQNGIDKFLPEYRNKIKMYYENIMK